MSKRAGVALAFQALQEKDKVGLLVFGKDVKESLPPSDNFGEILNKIIRIKTEEQTQFRSMIQKAIELFPKEENIVIPAGGTYNKEFQIESALLAKPKRLMVTFSLEGKEVVEKEVVVESKKIIGSAVDIDTKTNTFDLYLAIPAREEEKTEYYWLELNINKALDSKVALDNKVSKTEDNSVTGLAVSNLKESDATLFSELYGPYKIKSNEGILFGQEFSYSQDDYYGPVLMKTRVFKDGQTVLDNSFTVNLGPAPAETLSLTEKVSLAGQAVWQELKFKTTARLQPTSKQRPKNSVVTGYFYLS
ncbi:VWA domain-containing protein [Candidatus Woesearchaeota archaeon]|nr:VWA domain-containing protein [Candidatus Woesearchaeota archaeon]